MSMHKINIQHENETQVSELNSKRQLICLSGINRKYKSSNGASTEASATEGELSRSLDC